MNITKNQFFELNRRVDDIIQQQNKLLQAIQDADMASLVKTYEYLNLFMPEWGRSTVAAMQKFGYISGTTKGKYDLSEDLLRLLVFFDRGNIGTLSDSSVTMTDDGVTYSYLETKNKFDDYFARIAENEQSVPIADAEGNLTYPAVNMGFQLEGKNVYDSVNSYNISFNIVTPVVNQSTDSSGHWRFKYAGQPQFDTVEQIYGYFKQRGFSVAAICGLLGNALQECGNQTTFLVPLPAPAGNLNIKAVGIEADGSRSRGIWQFNEKSFPDSRALGNVWEQCELLNSRLARDFQVYGSNFPRFLSGRGDQKASEYQNFNLETYKKMTDPGYAALAFCVVFERCADQYVLPRGHLGWVALNELFEYK